MIPAELKRQVTAVLARQFREASPPELNSPVAGFNVYGLDEVLVDCYLGRGTPADATAARDYYLPRYRRALEEAGYCVAVIAGGLASLPPEARLRVTERPANAAPPTTAPAAPAPVSFSENPTGPQDPLSYVEAKERVRNQLSRFYREAPASSYGFPGFDVYRDRPEGRGVYVACFLGKGSPAEVAAARKQFLPAYREALVRVGWGVTVLEDGDLSVAVPNS